MTRKGHSSFCLVAIVVGAAANSAAYAQERHAAAHRHDGVYVIHITTRHGSCGEHNWRIAVSSGHVRSAGHTPAKASGHVSKNGSVFVAFHHSWHVAKAIGRLGEGSGAGTWSLPSMHCAGSWRAMRQS
jgi:hypothetical protein